MRVLANENVPGPVIRALRELGHDVLWAKEQDQSRFYAFQCRASWKRHRQPGKPESRWSSRRVSDSLQPLLT
jgi:hypothetical protein